MKQITLPELAKLQYDIMLENGVQNIMGLCYKSSYQSIKDPTYMIALEKITLRESKSIKTCFENLVPDYDANVGMAIAIKRNINRIATQTRRGAADMLVMSTKTRDHIESTLASDLTDLLNWNINVLISEEVPNKLIYMGYTGVNDDPVSGRFDRSLIVKNSADGYSFLYNPERIYTHWNAIQID